MPFPATLCFFGEKRGRRLDSKVKLSGTEVKNQLSKLNIKQKNVRKRLAAGQAGLGRGKQLAAFQADYLGVRGGRIAPRKLPPAAAHIRVGPRQ